MITMEDQVKKIFLSLICLIMLFAIISCDQNNTHPNGNDDPPSDLQDTPAWSETDDAPAGDKTNDFTSLTWRDAYLEILEARKDISPSSYALVYVDADEIPELYVSGCCEAEGDIIYSFKNGNLFMQYLNRRFAGRYIEKGGLIINQNGHMGRYYTTIYTLCEDGFVLNFSGVRTESYEHIGGDNYITHTQYSIGEEVVSEDEFDAAVNSLFDFSRSKEFYTDAVSYNEIMQQLGVTVSDGK